MPAPLALALLGGVLAGVLLGWMIQRGDSPAAVAAIATSPAGSTDLPALPKNHSAKVVQPEAGVLSGESAEPDTQPSGASAPAAGLASSDTLVADLRRGVAAAKTKFGGRAEAALLIDGWARPVLAGDAGGRMRMWSMSKPVTAVAVYERPSGGPQPTLQNAIDGALRASENCRQRRVVLGLEELTGGVAQAREAFRSVLARAGARGVSVPPEPANAPPECQQYLTTEGAPGIKQPLGPALQLGTSEWTVADAAKFAYALGAGRYGAAGERVVALMRAPKRRSSELADPSEYSARENWGAGTALADFQPAYKAGWGGYLTGQYLAGQLVVMRIGGHSVGVAAAFHPDTQPRSDDPGDTKAPAALETIFRALRPDLRALGSSK